MAEVFATREAGEAEKMETQESPVERKLKELEGGLKSQMRTQEKWIKEVNTWRRDNFQKSARKDALRKFRLQLAEEYSGDGGLKFFEDVDIQTFAGGLATDVVNEFSEEIPVFEDKSQVLEWCDKLRGQMSSVVEEVLEQNRRKRESLEERLKAATAKVKDVMGKYFEEHPFAKQEEIERILEEAKIEVEEEETQLLSSDPEVKLTWDSRVSQEIREVESLWRAKGDEEIASFIEALKADGQKLFQERFGSELDRSALDNLFSPDASSVVRRHLETTEMATGRRSSSSKSTSKVDGPTTTTADRDPPSPSVPKNSIAAEASEPSMFTMRRLSTPAPIGVQYDEEYIIVIAPNTELPSSAFRCLGVTAEDDQTSSCVSIYEGEDPTAQSSKKLGELLLTGIPPGKKGEEKVCFVMEVDAFGILHVDWEVRSTGKKLTAEFRTSAWYEEEEESQTGIAIAAATGEIDEDASSSNKQSNKETTAVVDVPTPEQVVDGRRSSTTMSSNKKTKRLKKGSTSKSSNSKNANVKKSSGSQNNEKYASS